MKKNNRLAAIGMTAGLLAGGAAGLILEASGSASAAQATPVTTPDVTSGSTATGATTATDASTDASTTKAGRQADRLANRQARLAEVLKPLVDDGTITQAQADKVVAALIDAAPLRGLGGPALTKAAQVIGISVADLRTEVLAGKTVAEVAAAKGSTAQAVIDAVVADAKARLDAKVADGSITQAQADTRLAASTTWVTSWVNDTQKLPMDGPGGRKGGPGMGQRGDRRGGKGGQHGFGGTDDGAMDDGGMADDLGVDAGTDLSTPAANG